MKYVIGFARNQYMGPRKKDKEGIVLSDMGKIPMSRKEAEEKIHEHVKKFPTSKYFLLQVVASATTKPPEVVWEDLK